MQEVITGSVRFSRFQNYSAAFSSRGKGEFFLVRPFFQRQRRKEETGERRGNIPLFSVGPLKGCSSSLLQRFPFSPRLRFRFLRLRHYSNPLQKQHNSLRCLVQLHQKRLHSPHSSNYFLLSKILRENFPERSISPESEFASSHRTALGN